MIVTLYHFQNISNHIVIFKIFFTLFYHFTISKYHQLYLTNIIGSYFTKVIYFILSNIIDFILPNIVDPFVRNSINYMQNFIDAILLDIIGSILPHIIDSILSFSIILALCQFFCPAVAIFIIIVMN